MAFLNIFTQESLGDLTPPSPTVNTECQAGRQ